MEFEVEARILPSTPVMFTARSLPYDRIREIGKDFGAITKYVARNGGKITGSFIRYVGECTMENMNMEICFSVERLLPECDGIMAKIIPENECKTARGIHKGSYEGLAMFYIEMDKWFNAQGLIHAAEPMWEIYLNNPAEVSEDDLLTEILWPISNGTELSNPQNLWYKQK